MASGSHGAIESNVGVSYLSRIEALFLMIARFQLRVQGYHDKSLVLFQRLPRPSFARSERLPSLVSISLEIPSLDLWYIVYLLPFI